MYVGFIFFQEVVRSTNGLNIFRVIDEKRKCLVYENGTACAGISVISSFNVL